MKVKHVLPLILSLVFLLPACRPYENMVAERVNPFVIQSGSTPLVIAHRGGRGLAPENTLVAFDQAVAMGVDVLEMDVCVTADGIAVTLHDLTIDRTSDGEGDVSTFTYEELQAFNFGAKFRALDGTYPYADIQVPIPTVEQIFARYPNQLIEIEIKSPGALGRTAARELLRLIEAYNMVNKVIVFSFFDDVMQYYRSIAPKEYFTGASLGESIQFVGAVLENRDTIVPLRVDMFAFPYDLQLAYSPAVIRAANIHRIGIHYWTVNGKDDMQKLIEKGAHGIITDRPDLMFEVLEEMGYR